MLYGAFLTKTFWPLLATQYGAPKMLRITMISETSEEVILQVEGWISEEDVDLLEQEGTRWMQEVRRLSLDLTGVRFIDMAGIALLQRWSEQGLGLCGGSRFVRSLLNAHGLGQRR